MYCKLYQLLLLIVEYLDNLVTRMAQKCTAVSPGGGDGGDGDEIPLGAYFVDPDGIDDAGRDGHEGQEWASLSYACSRVSTPGSTIYINAGQYDETSVCSLAEGVSIQGAGKEIVEIFSSVTGTRDSTGITDATIELKSGSENTNGNQSISHISLLGGLEASVAIYVKQRNNVIVHDCIIDEFYINGITFQGTSTPYVEPTIYSTGNQFYNCTIKNCGDTPGTWDGGALYMIAGQSTMEIHDNILENTERATGHNSNIGNISSYVKGIKYHNNKSTKPTDETAWNFHWEAFMVRGGIEIYNNEFYGGDCCIDFAGDVTEKGTYDFAYQIHDNYFYDNPTVHSDHGKVTIDFESLVCTDIYIYNNHFEGQVVPIGISDNTNKNNTYANIYIYSNIMWKTGYNNPIDWTNSIGINLQWPSTITGLYFYNNVLLSNPYEHTAGFKIETVAAAGISNLFIKNNIICHHGNGTFLNAVNNGSMDGLEVDNNCLYDNSGSNNPTFSGNAVTNYTFNDNLQGIDPQFVNETLGNFHIFISSPCANQGIAVSLPTGNYDYDYETFDTPPSIGAFEHL